MKYIKQLFVFSVFCILFCSGCGRNKYINEYKSGIDEREAVRATYGEPDEIILPTEENYYNETWKYYTSSLSRMTIVFQKVDRTETKKIRENDIYPHGLYKKTTYLITHYTDIVLQSRIPLKTSPSLQKPKEETPQEHYIYERGIF